MAHGFLAFTFWPAFLYFLGRRLGLGKAVAVGRGPCRPLPWSIIIIAAGGSSSGDTPSAIPAPPPPPAAAPTPAGPSSSSYR
jgi:hypothetical protein